MRKLKCALTTAAGVLVVMTGGCGPGEMSAEEKAAAVRRHEAAEKARLAERLAAFPRDAEASIAALEAITPRDVADVQDASEVIRMFDGVAVDIRMIETAAAEGSNAVSEEAKAAKERLRRVLIRKQVQLFPHMRRAYAAYMSEAVAGARANFRAVGPGGKTLRAASPSFVSRDVVMDAHFTLVMQATRFRFTRAEYVYALTGASDAATIPGGADDDI